MKITAVFTAFLFAATAQLISAKDIYVSQNGAGNASGADVADAYPLSWLDNSANWGSAANLVNPGDIVHLCGTLTNTLTVSGSGTAGNPITIYFEPNAGFVAPTFPNSTALIYMPGVSYVTVDGGSNGIIACTDNGTSIASGGTHNYTSFNLNGILMGSVTNVIVQNLTISNLYDRQTGTDPVQGPGDSTAINGSGSFITIRSNFISGTQDGISMGWGSSVTSNLLVYGNIVSNYNHGFIMGAARASNPKFYNLYVSNNYFLSGDMYETVGPDLGLHRNGIFVFDEAGDYSGVLSNVVICCNVIWHGYHPRANSVAAGSGGTFFDCYRQENYRHVRIFNNVIGVAAPLSWSGGGGFVGCMGTDVLVANNTCIGGYTNGQWYGGNISIGGNNARLYNNILISGNGDSMTTVPTNYVTTTNIATRLGYFGGVWSDHNVLVNASQFVLLLESTNNFVWEPLFGSLNDWKTYNGAGFAPGFGAAHCDPHSTASSPLFLNGTYIPAANDTAAANMGTNLSAYFATDFAGNPRPANSTQNWTIGAFEASTLAQSPPPQVMVTATPSTLTNGQTFTLSWTTTNATSATLVGAGLVPLSGSTNLVASSTNELVTFSIAAVGPGGTNSGSAAVYLRPAPPTNLRLQKLL